MKVIIFLVLIMFPLSFTLAEDSKDSPEVDMGVCRLLVGYTQPYGVDYESGIDVKGNAVVPADLEKSTIPMPKVYSFDISIDLAEYLELDTPAGITGDIIVGTLFYDGKSWFINGKPMDDSKEKILKALCNGNSIDGK